LRSCDHNFSRVIWRRPRAQRITRQGELDENVILELSVQLPSLRGNNSSSPAVQALTRPLFQGHLLVIVSKDIC
jgi:hypothetical protein